MPASGARKPLVSIEDYLAGEADGEQRHDYIDGQVYAMTGASDRHGLLASALAYGLMPAARRKGCQLFVADMKVRVDYEQGEVMLPCLDMALSLADSYQDVQRFDME